MSALHAIRFLVVISISLTFAGIARCEPLAADTPKPAPAAKEVRKDLYGDPLPPGAIARMGTARFRHAGRISNVMFAPDGKTVASAGHDYTARLWDAATGKQLQLFKLPFSDSSAAFVAYSPDGKLLAVTDGTTVWLWDPVTGKEVRKIQRKAEFVTSAVFSPDGTKLAMVSPGGALQLCEVATGNEIRRFRLRQAEEFEAFYGGRSSSVVFSPDGKLLASVGNNRAARLWEVASGQEIRQLSGPKLQVESVAFSPDGKTLATAGYDKIVRLWEVLSGKEIRQLPGGVKSVVFSPDGKTVAASGDKIRLWDAATGKQIRELDEQESLANSIAFSPNGKTMASGGSDMTVHLWDVATGKEICPPKGHKRKVLSVAVSPDGKTVASTGMDKTVRLWDITTGKELRQLQGHEAEGLAVAFAPDGKTLASASADKTLWLWDVATGKAVREFKGHQDRVNCAVFSPDGKILASASDDMTVRFWETASGKEIRKSNGLQEKVGTVAFAPDGAMLASGSQDGKVHLWEVATGKILREIGDPFDRQRGGGQRGGFGSRGTSVDAVVFSPDGKTLAVASLSFGNVRLLDVASGEQIRRLQSQDSSLLFSPDGRMLATFHRGDGGDFDRGDYVQFWAVATGKLVCTLVGQQGGIRSIVFSPDGKKLISAGGNGTILVWQLSEIVPPDAFPSVIPDPKAGDANTLWADLASPDAARAYKAIAVLVLETKDNVQFLQQRIKPAAPAAPVAPVVAPTPDQLRTIRAVMVLEQIATPEAKKLLETLSKGADGALLTEEAKASLKRLAARDGSQSPP